jgi:hypothetical protein
MTQKHPRHASDSGIAGRRKRNRLNEQFSAHTISMLESPAWATLSRGAHQFLSRLEIELAHHGGNDNGKLPLTYRDLMRYGMTRDQIAPAMREAVALGFAECTKRGRGGNADSRAPSRWRITYVQCIGDLPTHDWRKIKTMLEAKAMATAARAAKDPNRVAFGQRQKNRNRSGKPGLVPVRVSRIETPPSPVRVSRTTGSVRKPGLLSISGVGRDESLAAGDDARSERSNPRSRAPKQRVYTERDRDGDGGGN